ncbi:MAG: PKD domain-containing protein [Verrucomicrobiota bacterium JB022]|nr:PKD domain-containing protein [Verrucomicrobiota bacterium JB022]
MKTASLLPLALAAPLLALDRPGEEFPIYQFPANAIPRIDGDPSDWAQVPARYIVGTDELWEDSGKHEKADPQNLDVSVRVAWVKGLNRLYFLYEAYDDYWDFGGRGLKNDTFEIVVDADLSGGTLISRFRENADVVSDSEAFYRMQGAHAQNYHIFTPAREKDWAMYWGPAQWLKRLPFANAAYSYDFEPGESGKLTLEFWITPFDYASPEGPEASVPSKLVEDTLIGLSWAIIDYDDADSPRNNGFWNLSRTHTMYGQASQLVAFRLMPLEPELAPKLDAQWSAQIVDRDRRVVAFVDESAGNVTSWHWDFGDGETSSEQHPVHQYQEPGNFVTVLTVKGPDGSSTLSKVWEVMLP